MVDEWDALCADGGVHSDMAHIVRDYRMVRECERADES